MNWFENPKIVARVLSLAVVSFLGVTAMENAMGAENPFLHKADVRVMGDGGEVLVYYKDGNDIVVRNCGRDYPNVNQRSDCKGTENKVPMGVFKQVLRSQFLDIVNKIADDKTLHKVADGKDSDQAMFNLLRQFDASKGECGTDAILNGRKQQNPGDDDAVPGTVRRATWLLNVLIPDARAAGYTVEDRIRNCIALPNAIKKTQSGVSWNLVSRSRDPKIGKFYEVWKDSQSGLLWGDRLDKRYTHHDAIALGINGKVVSETACGSDEGKVASAGIGEKKFGLPTIEEFQQAEKNGVREVLPNMKDYFFWSASRDPGYTGYARGFNGYDGVSSSVAVRVYVNSVRCVGR